MFAKAVKRRVNAAAVRAVKQSTDMRRCLDSNHSIRDVKKLMFSGTSFLLDRTSKFTRVGIGIFLKVF